MTGEGKHRAAFYIPRLPIPLAALGSTFFKSIFHKPLGLDPGNTSGCLASCRIRSLIPLTVWCILSFIGIIFTSRKKCSKCLQNFLLFPLMCLLHFLDSLMIVFVPQNMGCGTRNPNSNSALTLIYHVALGKTLTRHCYLICRMEIVGLGCSLAVKRSEIAYIFSLRLSPVAHAR